MDVHFIKQGSSEWNMAWKGLVRYLKKKHGHISDMVDMDNGEAWQYMGTFGYHHEFRHRSFRGNRTVVNIMKGEN